jgi:hypothetical protein
VETPGIEGDVYLREECQANETLRVRSAPPVISDEVPKTPALLTEVHGLIENSGVRFVL